MLRELCNSRTAPMLSAGSRESQDLNVSIRRIDPVVNCPIANNADFNAPPHDVMFGIIRITTGKTTNAFELTEDSGSHTSRQIVKNSNCLEIDEEPILHGDYRPYRLRTSLSSVQWAGLTSSILAANKDLKALSFSVCRATRNAMSSRCSCAGNRAASSFN